MRDAVIVEAVRTPVGKRNGGLAGVHPADLSAAVLDALMSRTGVDPGLVDDVVWGCVGQVGEQSFNIARTALLSAGFPETVPGTTVDRQCGSSQQAVHFAAAGIVSGQYDIAVAGGVEVMSRVPMAAAITQNPFGTRYADRYGSEFPNQGLAAEWIANHWDLTRQQQDEFALSSHAKAGSAISEGRFADQIIPVATTSGVVDTDEGVREGGTVEKLGALKPAFMEGGVVTAANSSQISDGAAALLLMTSDKARDLGLRPLVRIHTAVLAGVAPFPMLTGPIPATEKVIGKSGLSLADIGAFECNEAFASVVLAWIKEVGIDEKLVNPNGGAIALGHPLGGSGARIMTTLVHHMRDSGIEYGMQTMCEGGGMANATILQSV